MVCPPATLIASFAKAASGTPVAIGGQDRHPLASGAHTGDISAEMLRDAGAQAVIVGHSERRRDHDRNRYAGCAPRRWRRTVPALVAIVCIGETREDREFGQKRVMSSAGSRWPRRRTLPRIPSSPMSPFGAIGTGKHRPANEIGDIHDFISRALRARFGEAGHGVRILYGGSVKPANAKELLAVENVDGALVGGASLDAAEFLAIAGVYC